MGRLQNKAILVTGATSGLGRAAALHLAGEGARVGVVGRNAERGREVCAAIERAGGAGLFIAADLTREQDVDRMMSTFVERFGRLDAAVNAAAEVELDMKTVAELETDAMETTMRSVFTSVFWCMRAQLRQALAQTRGPVSLVNVSSVNGLGAAPRAPIYSAAKAAVIALAKACAVDHAADGIRVNVVVPGGFDTPMLRSAIDRVAGGDETQKQAVREAYSSRVPLGRIGRVEEFAGAIVWLCSDESTYVTGSSIVIDGGMTSYFR